MSVYNSIRKLYFLTIVSFIFILMCFVCGCIKTNITVTDAQQSESKISDELNSIVKIVKSDTDLSQDILNAYIIDNDKKDIPSTTPEHFLITYAIEIPGNEGSIYKLYDINSDYIGELERKQMNSFCEVVNQGKTDPKSYIYKTLIIDKAFSTNFCERLADDRYDIKELGDSIAFSQNLLLNLIKQLKGEENPKFKLSEEEINYVNNNK